MQPVEPDIRRNKVIIKPFDRSYADKATIWIYKAVMKPEFSKD